MFEIAVSVRRACGREHEAEQLDQIALRQVVGGKLPVESAQPQTERRGSQRDVARIEVVMDERARQLARGLQARPPSGGQSTLCPRRLVAEPIPQPGGGV